LVSELARAQQLAGTTPQIYGHFYGFIKPPKIFIATIMGTEKNKM
jgi:hypothetical protein